MTDSPTRPTEATALLRLPVRGRRDIVPARQRVRLVAERLHFSAQDQTRISTAVSEIVRNSVEYAEGGQLDIALVTSPGPLLRISISDDGPGIADVDDVLAGRSERQGGRGLIGARNLMDGFAIDTSALGTTITLEKRLPPGIGIDQARSLAADLATRDTSSQGGDAYAELEAQHRELMASLSEIQEREERLRGTLRDRDVLLREVHHRVKNNLQLILSMIRLQSAQIRDPGTRDALKVLSGRIRSISEIHNRLYGAQSTAEIDLSAYLAALCKSIEASVGARTTDLRLAVDTDVHLDLELAQRIGLIVNELVMNAYKHAFAEDAAEGRISVAVSQAEGRLSLEIADTGAGVADPEMLRTSGSLGMSLVRSLCKDYSGDLQVLSTPGVGTTVRLDLPLSRTFSQPREDATPA